MPAFNSNNLLTQLQTETEDFLNKAIQQWQMLPTQQMLFKQSPEKWSAAQCLAHLNSYGDYYLPALEAGINKALLKKWQAKEIFNSSWLGNFFTNLMLPKGEAKAIKKMKAPKNHIPADNLNSDEVLATFIKQQEQLLQLLEKAKTINIRKAKTPVSIAKFIKLPVGDTFRFLVAHNYRHVLQAKRAMDHYKASAVMA